MTTIAWDGHSLAADQASWSGGLRRRVCKVYEVYSPEVAEAPGRRILVGLQGNGSFAVQVLAWLRGERQRPNPLDFMPAAELDRACAVVIDEKRRVWLLGNDLHYQPMRDKVFSLGAGQEMALGALQAGASARRAVEIVIKCSDYAGLGVDVVRF
ncbi:hypothetical protein BN948_01764 [Hydrogenophaga intermedia]|uniref:Uncharacterized protein n=1 Tax=Hydrogenophaga intermedia TaxID=65786 RepID=A0A1L1PBE5_HYDIT|nr:hypothetical protein [Hydrogenophaga intermedia]CDN87342.1 hypothetical protein BN948_01764 [Hydrogenophaga intermedia]